MRGRVMQGIVVEVRGGVSCRGLWLWCARARTGGRGATVHYYGDCLLFMVWGLGFRGLGFRVLGFRV